MTKKSRKPLNDALAEQFVYGGESEAVKGDSQRERFAEREPDARTDETSLPTEVEQEEKKETSSPTVEAAQPVTSTKAKKESSLMDKLQIESKEATIRFTVDLPESMHRKLSVLAAKTGRKKAEIVRMLLDEALKEVED
jgi:hypothetical protein